MGEYFDNPWKGAQFSFYLSTALPSNIPPKANQFPVPLEPPKTYFLDIAICTPQALYTYEPKKSQLGNTGTSTISLVVLHTDNNLQKSA